MGVSPFDAGELEFCVSSEFSGGTYSSDDFGRFVQGWTVTVALRNLETEEIIEERLGNAEFVRVDTSRIRSAGEHPFHVLDAQDIDLYTYGAALFGSTDSGYAEDLDEELLSPFGRLLVLERVWVDPRYRGFGLGPVLAAVGLDALLPGCALAACAPAPTEGDLDGAERERAVAAIARTWESLGFEPFRDGIWILDPAGRPAEEGIEQALDRLG